MKKQQKSKNMASRHDNSTIGEIITNVESKDEKSKFLDSIWGSNTSNDTSNIISDSTLNGRMEILYPGIFNSKHQLLGYLKKLQQQPLFLN